MAIEFVTEIAIVTVAAVGGLVVAWRTTRSHDDSRLHPPYVSMRRSSARLELVNFAPPSKLVHGIPDERRFLPPGS